MKQINLLRKDKDFMESVKKGRKEFIEERSRKQAFEQFEDVRNESIRKKYARQEKEVGRFVDKNVAKAKKVAKQLDKKVLSKPKAKIPKYSPKKAYRNLADNAPDRLVKEVEPVEVTQDNRSLFFKEEFAKESKKSNSWLS